MFSFLSNGAHVLNLYPLHSAERPRSTVNKRTLIKKLKGLKELKRLLTSQIERQCAVTE